jgi:tetratricopeptide (TPR) repeat protein
MGNKIVKILWFIILLGILFIANHFFAADGPTLDTEKPDSSLVVEENTIDLSDQDLNYQQYINKGDDHFSNSDFASAIAYYLKAYEISPSSREVLNRLGEAYLKNNQAVEAKSFFQASGNQLGLARAHLNLREVESARAVIDKLNQGLAETQYYQGIIAIIDNDFEKAENIFTEIDTSTQKNSTLSTKIQHFLDNFETFSYYKETDQIFLQLMLAKSLTINGEYQSAIPILFKVIDKKNNYRDSWIVLGYCYLNVNEALSAIDAFKQAEALDPEKSTTLFFLGLAYFANNEVQQAISYLEAADDAGYEPKDQINLKLGDLYLIQENYRKAAVKYEKVLVQNPSNLDIFVRAVWINVDKINEVDTAVKLAGKALQSHPDSPMSYNLAGWAYTVKEDYPRAERYLNMAMELDPNFDAVNLNFGLLYEKQGQTILAKEHYKKAYQMGGGNSIANLAAQRFNRLTEQELQQYYQANISSP